MASTSSPNTNTITNRKPTAIESLGAGAISGGIARFVIAPLDVIKIRYQISSEHGYRSFVHAWTSIVREEGIRAFWKGNLAAELMVVPYGAVSFVSYNAATRFINNYNAHHQHPLLTSPHMISLLSGSFAGFTATVATYPTDLLRTRLAAQRHSRVYSSLSNAIVTITRGEGMRGLYAGLGPTLVGIVPYMALQFTFYEAAKTSALAITNRSSGNSDNKKLGATTQAACGFISGVASKLATMPFDVIKKRYQIRGFPMSAALAPNAAAMQSIITHTIIDTTNINPATRSATITTSTRASSTAGMSWWQCARDIVQQDGWRGLFRGSVPSLIKAGPNSAVTFMVYETTIRYLTRPSSSP